MPLNSRSNCNNISQSTGYLAVLLHWQFYLCWSSMAKLPLSLSLYPASGKVTCTLINIGSGSPESAPLLRKALSGEALSLQLWNYTSSILLKLTDSACIEALLTIKGNLRSKLRCFAFIKKNIYIYSHTPGIKPTEISITHQKEILQRRTLKLMQHGQVATIKGQMPVYKKRLCDSKWCLKVSKM